MNTIVSPGWYTDALTFKVTGPVLSECGGLVGVARGVGMGFFTGVEDFTTAVGGVVELAELLVLYGPQPASNARATMALRGISRRYIDFIPDLLVISITPEHLQEVPGKLMCKYGRLIPHAIEDVYGLA